jgi:predicted RNA binding protein YcfA (HicA-like mRNA interferase family)
MSGLPVLRLRQLIRALERAGFFVHHVRGSHHYLATPTGLGYSSPFHFTIGISSAARCARSSVRPASRTKSFKTSSCDESSQLKRPEKVGRVTVAGKPSDDVAPGTLNSILKQAGLKE